MPQLLIDLPTPVLIPLSGDEVTIGRSPSNDVVLDSAVVSRFHCRIEPMTEGGCRVVDLGSANGTYVNGRPVSMAVLEPYDQVVLGTRLLVFIDDHTEPTFALDRVRSMPCAWAKGSFAEADDDVPAYEQRNRVTHIHQIRVDQQDTKQCHYQELLLRVSLLAQELDCQADLCRLMNTIMDELLTITGFEAALLVLRDEIAGSLQPVSGRQTGHAPLVAEEWVFSTYRAQRSLQERVLTYEKPSGDSADHTLCLPLDAPRRWAHKERRRRAQPRTSLGLFYLAGSMPGRILKDEDAWMVDALSAQAASVIQSTRLQHQATTDTLTGLKNRLYMAQAFEDELTRCESAGVLMLDLDHFKLVNDIYGHSKGDEVLRRVAQRIRCHTRQEDHTARWGGEEFLILLPGETHDGVLAAATKIAAAISRQPIGEERLRVTASMGVAMFPQHGLNVSELVSNADKALYQAKNAGRDCLRMHQADSDDWSGEVNALLDDMSRRGKGERIELADVLWATTPPDPPR